MTFVIENQLFPCIDYFKKLVFEKHIRIEKYEHFQKNSFRNRYVIATANGPASLTIPIAGGRDQKAVITEIEIDNAIDWRVKHWRSITSAYRKAPFFDYYAEEIKSLIYNPETRLFNFNICILDRLLKTLDINAIISFTDQYSRHLVDEDYRNKLLPNSFQKAASDWHPRYSQVFEDRIGFQPNLSILDLLFCEGRNTRSLLEQSSRMGI